MNGAAYTFAVGATTVSASALDNAGNAGNGSATFTVAVTPGSLCALATQWVNQPGKGEGVHNSLCVKLAQGQVADFVSEVSAQSGKTILAEQAAILIALANQL